MVEDPEFQYVENLLTGDNLETEYLHFVMPVDDYVQYDDADVYD